MQISNNKFWSRLVSLKLLLALFVISIAAVEASPFSEFSRCYGILTGMKLTRSHPSASNVIEGRLSPVDACMGVFYKALLNDSGIAIGDANSSSDSDLDRKEARAVLATLHAFHRSWFPSDSFKAALNLETETNEQDIYDPGQAANHLSRILFDTSTSYQDLVKGTRTVESIRTSGRPTMGRFTDKPASWYLHRRVEYPAVKDVNNEDIVDPNMPSFNPVFLQVGVLRGFRVLSSEEENVIFQGSGGAPARNVANGLQQFDIEYQKSRGGGAMGTISYLLLNMGFGFRGGLPISDGGTLVGRRWSRSVFSDFMCRDLPVADAADTNKYLRPSSTLGFRTQSTCTNCHASIDGAAGILRNFAFIPSTDTFNPYLPHSLMGIAEYPMYRPDGALSSRTDRTKYLTAETDIFGSDRDTSFYNRPPNGRYIYRSAYSGEPRDVAISSLDQMGEQMAAEPDFYICAAKRYFEFFTNRKVVVVGGANSTGQNAVDRSAVIQLGLNLKNTQSLRQLIRDILAHPAYLGGR